MSCHNSTKSEGGVRLNSIDELRHWESRIRVRALNQQDMPPNNALSVQEQIKLKKWLDAGAPFVQGEDDWSVSEIPSFEEIKLRVFKNKCLQCHSGSNTDANLDLENYETVKQNKVKIIALSIADDQMPLKPIGPLNKKEKKLLSHWFIEGMPL